MKEFSLVVGVSVLGEPLLAVVSTAVEVNEEADEITSLVVRLSLVEVSMGIDDCGVPSLVEESISVDDCDVLSPIKVSRGMDD